MQKVKGHLVKKLIVEMDGAYCIAFHGNTVSNYILVNHFKNTVNDLEKSINAIGNRAIRSHISISRPVSATGY